MAETEPTGSVRGVYPTPSWVHQRPGDHDDLGAPPIPAQPSAGPPVVRPQSHDPKVPLQAAWSGRSDTGALGALVALAAALLTVVGLIIAAVVRTPVSLILPAVAATALVLVRSQIATGAGRRTTLERSLLEVQTRRGPRRFDLAHPATSVTMSATPDDPTWQLVLDDHQGPAVVLTRREVPPEEIAPIVSYYRVIAAARAADRAFPLES